MGSFDFIHSPPHRRIVHFAQDDDQKLKNPDFGRGYKKK